jgi:hypothetical protein
VKSTLWRIEALGGLFLLALALNVAADRVYVTNRGGATLTVVDTGLLAEVAGSPVTVGTTPVDIATDTPPGLSPFKLFTANSGSDTVSVVGADVLGVMATITGDGTLGTFDTPSGLERMSAAGIGPTLAVVDQKVTAGGGRSTVRFIDPATNAVVDGYRENSPSARFQDVVFTSDGTNRRLWIADDGDDGITVLKFGPFVTGPPFLLPPTITYGGTYEYADFVFDAAAAPVYLVNPTRLATNGTTRVVAVSSTNAVVTILDAGYVPVGGTSGEPGALVATVVVPGTACLDVEVVGNAAYVTSTGGATNVHRIDLTTFAVASLTLVAGTATAGGLGVTPDGNTLLVGEGVVTGTNVSRIDITPPATFVLLGATPFASANFPFGFSSAPVGVGSGGGGGTTPPWIPPPTTIIGTGSNGSGGGFCGLLGLEALLALGLLRLLKR